MLKDIKKNFKMIGYVAKFVPLYFVSSIVYIIFSAVTSVANVVIIQNIIDSVIARIPFSEVLSNLLIYVVIILVADFFIIIHNYYLVQRCRYVYVKKAQRLMFEKTKNIDTECFDNPEFYNLFSRALTQGDVKGIDCYDNLVRLVRSLVTLLALGTLIILTDWWLILIILVECIISTIIQIRVEKIYYKADKAVEKYNRRHGYIGRVFYLEKFAGEIKATSVSDLLTEKHDKATVDIKRTLLKPKLRIFRNYALNTLIYNIFRNAMVYSYLMYKVFKDPLMTIGLFGSSVNAVMQFSRNFELITYSLTQAKKNSLFIDDFLWLMEYEPKIEIEQGLDLVVDKASLEVKDVSFRYPGTEEYVLKNIDLKVKPGEKIAIVGHNGAGKTTLIKLLLKFYLADEGEIYLNDVPYRELNEKSLRQNFSAIFQNFQVYSVSVLENVLLRKRMNEEDDSIVWEALEKAGLKEKIEALPKGLDTILTKEFDNDGLVLSGGERQKLVLARVFASKSPIIIFDEPTSNLDPLAEYDINKKIIELSHSKTVIMISHRLSTIVDASTIYLIDGGRVIEQGDHQSLLKLKGKYYQMFETQAKMYTDEDLMTN